LTWLAFGAGAIGAVPWLPRLQRWLEERRAAGRTGLSSALEAAVHEGYGRKTGREP
jgi:hypothetical protein